MAKRYAHSLKAAITKPTFVVLAGAALGGYFLPRYVQGMNSNVGMAAGAALAVLIATFV